MSFVTYFLKKNQGQKQIVGLTGLGLCLFVLIHMAGNLLILAGPSAYNRYAHSLHELRLFVFFELGLLALFVGHIVLSLFLWIKNRKAKGEGLRQRPARGKKALPWQHRLLWLQGGLLIFFLAFHLYSFKFGPYYETLLDGRPVRDIYRLVLESFKKPAYTVGYSLVLLLLSIHLFRGLPAALKSLGMSHPTLLSFVNGLSWLFTLGVSLGFLVPVWYIYFFL